jgi:protein gp37
VNMSQQSKIEWTEATWNPVRGCTKISDGCKHCYAETFAERFRGVKGHAYQQGFDLRLVPEKLAEPLRWRNPKMIFVNSMSDLFHEGVPDEYVKAVAEVMVAAKWHTYQVLTKRSERLRQILNSSLRFAANEKHIWWGVSVENRKFGLPRIEDLRSTNAAIKFLSVEPLLEDLGELNLKGIDWVIVGGESGHGARPMKKEWVVSVREQCRHEGVPFFFKQWGGVRKSAAGRRLDGKTYDEFPERTQNLVLSTDECRFLASTIESAFMKTNLVEILSPNISGVEDGSTQAAWDLEIARRLEDLNSGRVKPVSLEEARIQLSRYLH